MRAMILAAGLGTRLRPWTLEHPKALVPVEGVPMLERVILKLKSHGFGRIVVNVHHFAGQIVDFLDSHDFGVEITVSDESGQLLDTGGGIVHAVSKIGDAEPLLVHNVDILSSADLSGLMSTHLRRGDDVSLLTSDRESSRRLVFSSDDRLVAWHSLTDGNIRPSGAVLPSDGTEEAFSGIYVIGPRALRSLSAYGEGRESASFPIMDFFLSNAGNDDLAIRRVHSKELRLLDIGKPATLAKASELLG